MSLVLLVTFFMLGISIHAPSHSPSYAQMRQMGASLGMLESDNWILPHNHEARFMRKPQLYGWLTAMGLAITGIYSDFMYRLPSVAAALACTVLIYLMGRRWFTPSLAILATCLWATSLQMSKLMYLGTTDMLHTLWMTLALFCIDRVLFHKAPPGKRNRWVAWFWVAIILGGLSKGWGVANFPFIAFFLAMAATFERRFRTVGCGGTKAIVILRMVLRRWRHMLKAIRVGWGLLAFVVAMASIWFAMFMIGGKEFWNIVNDEIVQRIIGNDLTGPKRTSTPPLLGLIYCTLPGSILAIAAMALWHPGKWFSSKSPLKLPLLWIIAILLPFHFTSGYRIDYAMPCYVSVAFMAVIAIERLRRMGSDSRIANIWRHTIAAFVVTGGLGVSIIACICLFYAELPTWITSNLRTPYSVAPETWWILKILVPLGLLIAAAGIKNSLDWRLTPLAVLFVPTMLGLLFMYGHMLSEHSRLGDGEKLVLFAEEAKQIVGDDSFAVLSAEKMGTELYWGRFGEHIDLKNTQADLAKSNAKWLVTCDSGLLRADAYVPTPHGKLLKITKKDGKRHKTRVTAFPEKLGRVIQLSNTGPVHRSKLGRLYLIRLTHHHRKATSQPR